MYLQAVVICCLAIAHSSLCYDDVHRVMNDAEIGIYFQTTADSVPRHEFVRIESEPTTKTYSRKDGKVIVGATERIWLRTFGANINLWLHPAEKVLMNENTPVYHAQFSATEPGNVQFDKQDGAMRRIGQLYVDNEYRASMIIGRESSGQPHVYGHIGSHGLTVRSVPERVVKEYLRTRRSINEPEHISSNASYAVVYETPENIKEELFPTGLNRMNVRERIDRSADQEEIPSTLYPQILVVVENSLYTKLGNDDTKLLKYLLAFWNGVDLKYRSLERPRIRFSIYAIIIATETLGTPYIHYANLRNGHFDVGIAMWQGPYFFHKVNSTFPVNEYDIAVTMTSATLGGEGRGTVGKANIADACRRYGDTMESVAIVHDMGDFVGVHIAAHELGHSLGMIHDKDVINCKHDDGYIMAGNSGIYERNSWTFSKCSLEKFDTYLHSGRFKCLYNVPVITGKSLPKIMPGKFMTQLDVCKANGYETVCHRKPDVLCGNVHCRFNYGDTGCSKTKVPVPEGTPCGSLENMFCLRTRCTQIPMA